MPPTTPPPAPSYLASKTSEFLDSIFSLVSSKSPINLSPLQIGYDVASHALSAYESLVSPAKTLVEKAREAITGLFK